MSDTTTKRAPRADACRNGERLLNVARQAFVADGIDVSLEEIARRAEVGIGTLYRHFPNRQALVEAVLVNHMNLLVDRGAELLEASDPYDGLVVWLNEVLEQITTYRGATVSVATAFLKCGSDEQTLCDRMQETGHRLLVRAQDAGLVRDDIVIGDIITMVNAVGWIAEQGEVASSKRSLKIVLDGIRVHAAASPLN